ncbi:hypothetical protein ACRZ5S_23015 (plasmid) [Vibrio scophthalmi]|uniref:hypothetical protein n=1 Tax=Vibrio scophthalmi TaxID=45658 RepID=UPI003EB9E7B7
MKAFVGITAVLLFFSVNVSADPVSNQSLLVDGTHENVELPRYQALFKEVADSKRVNRQSKLLAFYSEILPWLRSNAYVSSEPNYIEAYSLAEEVSFRLARLFLTSPESMDDNDFVFYERIVIDDAFDVAQELTFNVLPLLETIDPESMEDRHAKN